MGLDKLGIKFGTDKSSKHKVLVPKNYCEVYEFFTKNKRNSFKNIVEFGVKKGASLKMWAAWFPKANIYGFDIKKINVSGNRIKSIQMDSTKISTSEFIKKINPDFIIDDASHTVSSHKESFILNFKNLRSGGIYAIEDLHTCFAPTYGGTGVILDNSGERTFEWLFEISKGLYFNNFSKSNQEYLLKKHPYIKDIKSVSFFKSLAIIEKK